MKFIGDRGPSDLGAALENERFVACLGQIKSGDQPVVAAANNDNVALV
jgi:hypothetical protein